MSQCLVKIITEPLYTAKFLIINSKVNVLNESLNIMITILSE